MPDTDRIRALAEYEVLDSLPEKEFDDIVELASAICGTPISAISLLDVDRQWFKAQVGLDINQTPLEQAFCRYAVQDPNGVMVVNDSTKDERFKNNPLTLDGPKIRFYAGAPLITDAGVALGALCVIDRVPRQFNEQEKRMLQVLAKRVMRLLELRKENLDQKKQISRTTGQLQITMDRLFEAQTTANIGNWEWDMTTGQVYWSPQIYRLMWPHQKPDSINDRMRWETIVNPEDLPAFNKAFDALLIDHKPSRVEFRVMCEGKEIWVLRTSDVKVNEQGKVERIYGIMQDITERKKAEKEHDQYVAMLESMLFDVSHKIRKPLTTLQGLLPILNEGQTSPEQFAQVSKFFYESMKELEGYTRELNAQLHQNKLDIER